MIDYYGGEDDVANDVPVFHLDVRPALDSFETHSIVSSWRSGDFCKVQEPESASTTKTA